MTMNQKSIQVKNEFTDSFIKEVHQIKSYVKLCQFLKIIFKRSIVSRIKIQLTTLVESLQKRLLSSYTPFMYKINGIISFRCRCGKPMDDSFNQILLLLMLRPKIEFQITSIHSRKNLPLAQNTFLQHFLFKLVKCFLTFFYSFSVNSFFFVCVFIMFC